MSIAIIAEIYFASASVAFALLALASHNTQKRGIIETIGQLPEITRLDFTFFSSEESLLQH